MMRPVCARARRARARGRERENKNQTWLLSWWLPQALILYPVYTAVEPRELLYCLSLSFLLDLFDGPLARLLHQTSWLGGILDVVCDNAGRLVNCAMCAACLGLSPFHLAAPPAARAPA